MSGLVPAAGANFTHNVDGKYVSRLKSCVFTLTTSAQAANRYVTVEYAARSATPFAVSAGGVFVTASTTVRFAGAINRGVSEWSTSGSDLTDVLFPLSTAFLSAGYQIKIKVANIDATDALSAIQLDFDRFPASDEWQRELAGRERA